MEEPHPSWSRDSDLRPRPAQLHFSAGAPGGGDRSTYIGKDPQTDRHFQEDTDAPTCTQLAARLPQQLQAGSWELGDPCQPCPSPTLSWNCELRCGPGAQLWVSLGRGGGSSVNPMFITHLSPRPCPGTHHRTPQPSGQLPQQ